VCVHLADANLHVAEGDVAEDPPEDAAGGVEGQLAFFGDLAAARVEVGALDGSVGFSDYVIVVEVDQVVILGGL
jgi:hypothetical protein